MTRLDRAPSGCAVLPRKDHRREKIFRAALLGALRADDFEDRFNQAPHSVTGEQIQHRCLAISRLAWQSGWRSSCSSIDFKVLAARLGLDDKCISGSGLH
jgi:hypothetical protein